MLLTKFEAALLHSLVMVSSACLAETKDTPNQSWINRAIETASLVVNDVNTPEHTKTYHIATTAGALGLHGAVKECNDFFERVGLENDSALRHEGLRFLSDGLASINRIDDAFATAFAISNVDLRDSALSIIPIRQSQNRRFDFAEALLARLPNQRTRDRALAQICREYLEVDQSVDAKRLCAYIADKDTLSKVLKEIETHLTQPRAYDIGYVDYKLNEARNRPFFAASDAELRFRSHYHLAEVAFAKNDQELFQKEAQLARAHAAGEDGTDGELLALARLLYKAGRKDDAKWLYLRLFEKYKSEADEAALDFNKIFFSVGDISVVSGVSDAEIVADCLSDDELKDVIEALAKRASANTVTAAIFSVLVKEEFPVWAEEIYQEIPNPILKADVAVSCLASLAKR